MQLREQPVSFPFLPDGNKTTRLLSGKKQMELGVCAVRQYLAKCHHDQTGKKEKPQKTTHTIHFTAGQHTILYWIPALLIGLATDQGNQNLFRGGCHLAEDDIMGT